MSVSDIPFLSVCCLVSYHDVNIPHVLSSVYKNVMTVNIIGLVPS